MAPNIALRYMKKVHVHQPMHVQVEHHILCFMTVAGTWYAYLSSFNVLVQTHQAGSNVRPNICQK